MAEIEKLVAAAADPSISELMINEDGGAYVERKGALERIATVSPQDAAAFLKGIVAENGFGPDRPYADLVAHDGSRVHVLAPPIVKNLTITVRKRPARRPTLEELCGYGALTENCARFLLYAVEQRKNILIVGGASSGKTTLLDSLCQYFDDADRVLVLEDTPELSIRKPHVNYLRTLPRGAKGGASVSLRDLVVNTLRMRPDRVVIGEVRGPEAADMLEAMNVGQEGVMATLHASSCREALLRMETLVLMGTHDIPLRAVRSNITTAVDLVVFLARLADGRRRVMQVAEVTGLEVENVTMIDLFRVESRKSPQGASFELRSTGAVPKFYDSLRALGHEPPIEYFSN